MLATDPTQTFDLVLKDDEGKEAPPTFVFRYLTAREYRALAHKEPKEGEALSVDEELGRCFSGIAVNLMGWRNVKDRKGALVKFCPTDLDTLVTLSEGWELYWRARRSSRLDVPAKNVSESQSPTSSGESAQATATQKQQTDTAPTDPPQSSPPSSSAAAATDVAETATDVAEPATYD